MDMYYLARDGVARVLKAQNRLFALGALGLLLLRERNQAEQQQKSAREDNQRLASHIF